MDMIAIGTNLFEQDVVALCNGVLAVGMRSGTTVLLELSGRLVRAPVAFALAPS